MHVNHIKDSMSEFLNVALLPWAAAEALLQYFQEHRHQLNHIITASVAWMKTLVCGAGEDKYVQPLPTSTWLPTERGRDWSGPTLTGRQPR